MVTKNLKRTPNPHFRPTLSEDTDANLFGFFELLFKVAKQNQQKLNVTIDGVCERREIASEVNALEKVSINKTKKEKGAYEAQQNT